MTSIELFIDIFAVFLGLISAMLILSFFFIYRKKSDGCYDD